MVPPCLLTLVLAALAAPVLGQSNIRNTAQLQTQVLTPIPLIFLFRNYSSGVRSTCLELKRHL